MRNQLVHVHSDGKGYGAMQTEEIVFGPRRSWSLPNLREVWAYRELLLFLAWRDIKVRYKQTVIGVAWAVLRPLMTMIVFAIIFGALIGVPSGDTPYPIFVYTGLLLWTFFASALERAASSLVTNAQLITKVYFPRLIIPLASVLVAAVDFVVAFVVLLVLVVVYRISLSAAILTIPLFLLLALLTALAAGLWLAAIEVKYRDVGHTVPFLIQFWFFVTPVAYPSSLIPERWQMLYGLNPMVGVIEGFRWALLGMEYHPSGELILISAVVVLFMLVGGLFFFRHTERTFVDVV